MAQTIQARRDWTPAEDEKLRTLRGKRTAREIGEQLGRTTSSVKGRLQKLNPSSGPALPHPAAGQQPPPEPPPAPAPEAPVSNTSDSALPALPAVVSPSAVLDPEIAALGAIYPLLAALSVPARRRTLRWLTERLTEPEASPPAVADDLPEGKGS